MSTRARILFFLPSFSGGGAERTVLNILKNYDKEVFELKVCLLDFGGLYSAMVPEHSILNSLDKGAFSISKSANPLYSLYKFFVFILPTQYRAIKTACHELAHVLSIRHCQAYECLMNGSSQLEEAD